MAITYINIATVTLGSTQTPITFSSIPQTYTDLALRVSARTATGGATDGYAIYLNNSFNINLYSYTTLEILFGSTASSSRQASSAVASFNIQATNGSGSAASTFGSMELYLPNYTLSAQKPLGIMAFSENSSTDAYRNITSGLSLTTSAINRIDIDSTSASGFVAGSTFYLYGIKNS